MVICSMAKRIPRVVRIGAHDYEVTSCAPKDMDPPSPSSIEANAKIGRHYTHYGSYYPGHQLIELNSELKESMKAETLLHEILHVIWELAGLRGLTRRGREEDMVQAIGHLLTQTLRDNPGLRRMFT